MSPLEKLQALKIQYDVINWEIENLKPVPEKTHFIEEDDLRETIISDKLKLIKMRQSICLLILDFPTNL